MEQSSENSDSDLSDSWAIISEDVAPQENGDCTEAEKHSDSEESVEVLHPLDEEDAGARTGAETDGISVISESDDLAEDVLDDVLIKEKKYIHHPNKKVNTILNIVLAMTVASVLGLGIGHYLGSQEEEDQRNTTYLVMELENKLLRHHLCHIILFSQNNLKNQNAVSWMNEQNKNYLFWVMKSMNLKCSKINLFGNQTSPFPRNGYNINYNPFIISKTDEVSKHKYVNESPQKVADKIFSSYNMGKELVANEGIRKSDISLSSQPSVQETYSTPVLNTNDDIFSTTDHTSNINVAEILLEIKAELIESIGQTFQLKQYIDNIDSKINKLVSHDKTCNFQQAKTMTSDIIHNLKQFMHSRRFSGSESGTQYSTKISDAEETDQYCKIADYLKSFYREVPNKINTLINLNTKSLQEMSTHDSITNNEKHSSEKGDISSDDKSDKERNIRIQRQQTKNSIAGKSNFNNAFVNDKPMKDKYNKQSNIYKHKHFDVITSPKYENKEYFKNKRKLYKKLHNFTNTSGDWLIQMGKGRSHIREMNHKSDWLFDRATSRKNKRRDSEAAYWYFQRAHDRKEQRYDDRKNFDCKYHFKTSDKEHNKRKYHETKSKCNQNTYPKYSKVKKWVSKAFMTATKMLKF